MRPSRTSLLGITALALALGFASTASGVVLEGKGDLVAYGSGFAVLELRGEVRLRALGLLIVEPDVEVETDGRGRSTFLEDGRILYEGFGRAVVRSPDAPTRIELGGAGIRLRARGVGRAFLKGRGVVHTRDHDAPWEHEGELELEGPMPE